MARSKTPNLTIQAAAAALSYHRATTPEAERITLDEARAMTAKQFLSLFHWDHGVLDTWTHDNHFANFTPRLIVPHRRKSGEDKAKVEKAKRLAREQEAFRNNLLAKHMGAAAHAADERRRRKIPSRPFAKGKRPMRRHP